MADIAEWDPVDDANTDAPPNGWPEFMQPSAVNNSARAMMGAIRRWYNTVNVALSNKVSRSGDTMSGNLTIATGGTGLLNIVKGGSGASSQISGGLSTGARWTVELGGPDVEAGGNTGSSFLIHRIADDGTYLGTPMTIARQTGAVTFAGNVTTGALLGSSLTVSGSVIAGGSLTTNGGNLYGNGWAILGGGGSVSFGTGSAGNLSLLNIFANTTAAKGDLTATGNIATPATVAGGAVFASSTVTANTNLVANGDNVLVHGESDFGIKRIGATDDRLFSFRDAYYLAYQRSTDSSFYVSPYGISWVWRVDGFNYSNIGAVGGHGGYVDMSDAALKEQIEPATQGLAEILRIQPSTFTRKPRAEGLTPRQELGFIAQDVQAALPHAVLEVSTLEGSLLGVTSEAIVAALVNAVKTLEARIAILEGGTQA